MTAAAEMTQDEAAWVREHAWNDFQRRVEAYAPEDVAKCPCQMPKLSDECEAGRCGSCNGWDGYPVPEGAIHWPMGTCAGFKRCYESMPYTAAFVQLADRKCRWFCSCSCHEAGHVLRDQLGLFDLAGTS